MTFFFHWFFQKEGEGFYFFLRKKKACGFLLVVLLIFITSPVFPRFKAFYPDYNLSLGAKSCSLGNAFTAVADDLSAVFWNPAGIADFLNPMIHVNFRINSTSYDYPLQETFEGESARTWESDFSSSLKNIDFISVSAPASLWNVKWNFALSYYRYFPYNQNGENVSRLTTEGGLTDIEKTILVFSGHNGIDVLGFSLAVYLSEYFSLGLTWQHFFNTGTIEYHIQSESEESITTFSERIRGQNLVIGCLFKAEKRIQLGFSYMTGLKNTLYSSLHYENLTDSVAEDREDQYEIYIPPRFSLAISIQPEKHWRLTYDFSKTFWSRATISISGETESELPFPLRNDYDLDQLDAVNHRLGMEIKFSVQNTPIFVRGGLFWEKQLFRDGQGEAIWMKGFSAGLGIHLLSKVVIDLAYMNRRADWKEAGYFQPDSWVDTRYRNHIFVLSVGYAFKRTPGDVNPGNKR